MSNNKEETFNNIFGAWLLSGCFIWLWHTISTPNRQNQKDQKDKKVSKANYKPAKPAQPLSLGAAGK